MSGVPAEDRNNIIYTPLSTAVMRLEDSQSMREGRDRRHLPAARRPPTRPCRPRASSAACSTTRTRSAGDFSIVVPAELLAQQRRTQRIFEMVMVAIASISLLVGGIGIMNIMLASILERTQGDRHPPRGRRAPADDHPPVPARGDADLVRRRLRRRPRRRRRCRG